MLESLSVDTEVQTPVPIRLIGSEKDLRLSRLSSIEESTNCYFKSSSSRSLDYYRRENF